MEEDKTIIPVEPHKVYRLGDGETRFTQPDERPLTGEEKYQKPLDEALADFNMALNNLAVAFVEITSPAIEALAKLAETPEVKAYIARTQGVDDKSEARQRSKDDVRRKRKDVMRRKKL